LAKQPFAGSRNSRFHRIRETLPDFVRHSLRLNGQYPDFYPCPVLKIIQQVDRRKHVQREIVRLLWRDLSDLYFEYLAGPLSRFESRVNDEDSFGPVGHEHEVEENLSDAGANIEGRHIKRQIEICQKMVDYRRTKTVVPDENISAAEY
jgi:hypothetical protein